MTLPDFLTRNQDDFIHLTGHRIGLHHVVHYYNEGYSAEMLMCQFPTLALALIHKVIAFYLENREEVDEMCRQHEAEMERLAAENPNKGPDLTELRRRLEAMQKAGAL